MEMMREQKMALALAVAIAVGAPAWTLLTRGPAGETPSVARASPAIAARQMRPLVAAYDRPLFAAPVDAVAATPPADAPALVGVAGRIDKDAVAMVRGADGRTRTLAIGDSIDGWKLAALAIDAAFFTRGAARVRVPLPTEDQ